jgi:diguanylate cyclase (GGDEF)-like protein/PAS domain S-box-containing protein
MNIRPSNILIVDDEIQNRRLLAVLLGPEGYSTSCASSGEEALAAVNAAAPDLILLDLMMPGIDGCEVASILKANPATAHIPIIMVTALVERSARLAGLDAGAEEFLTKPVDRAELWLRVRNLLRLKAFGDLESHSIHLEQQVQARTVELQRFRTAMDATADAIMLVSGRTLRFIEVNATACSMLGYTREELLAMSPSVLDGSDPEQLASKYAAIVASGADTVYNECEIQRKDGTQVHVEIHRQAMRSDNDWVIVAVVRDITARKDADRRLNHLAHHDPLTSLPNRMLFYATLRKTLEIAIDSDWKAAVLFVDLDNFKNVNDTLGHVIGDELLIQCSERLTKCVRIRDTVGRLGGDEFALILVSPKGQQAAALVASKIGAALRAPFLLHGHEVHISASVGIAVYPDDGNDPDTLIKYADSAMYRAKQAGRDTYRFFTAQMNVDALDRLDLETALRRAIDNEEFVLHYQPKVRLSDGRIAGVEALLRWERPGIGLVPPNMFIPLLEETGLIFRVGSWVIAAACKQIGAWLRSPVGAVHVAVNVSGRQFIESDLDAEIALALREYEVPAELLELELTETSMMANTERTISSLRKLKSRGVQISVDDFGTGYSSLAYLRRFPIDKLKIDIAFIRDVTTNPDDAAIVRAIISMAHSLKLGVIAEGVESEMQLNYLRRHDCDEIQGFYVSRPLTAEAVGELLVSRPVLNLTDGNYASQVLLIIDDDPFMLESLADLFGSDGYQILTAQSAAEGFDLLALQEVQVILCDQKMPDMNGSVFLDMVKELHPDTVRIVLSGQADLQPIMEAINQGAVYRFYTKPWDNKLLRKNVRAAFQHHRSMHAMSAGRRDMPQLGARI